MRPTTLRQSPNLFVPLQIKVQVAPLILPTLWGAKRSNAAGDRSMLPPTQPGHLSTMVTSTDFPFALTRARFLQIGFKLGFAPAPGNESNMPAGAAATSSLSLLVIPQEPNPGV